MPGGARGIADGRRGGAGVRGGGVRGGGGGGGGGGAASLAAGALWLAGRGWRTHNKRGGDEQSAYEL